MQGMHGNIHKLGARRSRPMREAPLAKNEVTSPQMQENITTRSCGRHCGCVYFALVQSTEHHEMDNATCNYYQPIGHKLQKWKWCSEEGSIASQNIEPPCHLLTCLLLPQAVRSSCPAIGGCLATPFHPFSFPAPPHLHPSALSPARTSHQCP